jgi:hypothetical protein
MSQFQLANGVLAWIEGGSNAPAIKASDGTNVTTVSSLTSAHFYGTSGGFVLFGESSNLYVWNAPAVVRRSFYVQKRVGTPRAGR